MFESSAVIRSELRNLAGVMVCHQPSSVWRTLPPLHLPPKRLSNRRLVPTIRRFRLHVVALVVRRFGIHAAGEVQ